MPNAKPVACRLTLSAEAFALALQKSEPLAGKIAWRRPDGKWDVAVKAAAFNQLRQMAVEKENLSDTVVRLLSGGLPVVADAPILPSPPAAPPV